MSKRFGFLLFNVIGLEVTWAACAYGVLSNTPLLGAVVGLTYIVVHMLLTPSRKLDIITLVALASIGIALDYISMKAGVLSFNVNSTSAELFPLWLIILWCVFSLMIPHSLDWLSNRPKLALVLGAFGGGGSYWLGDKLGAISLSEPLYMSVTIYFVIWAVYIIIAFSVYRLIKKSTFIKRSEVTAS